MTDGLGSREQILRRLAEGIDDDVLVRLFPDQRPEVVRRLIAGGPQRSRDGDQAEPPPSRPVAAAATPLLGRAHTGRCRLMTDGASRGNPGRAGAGAVLYSERGEELATRAVALGTCTNNVAEYKALLIGLDEVLLQGCPEVVIALDSELIVRQIQGRYKVKNEALLPLYEQVRQRLAQLKNWSISHVPRAQNARADQLANQGIDHEES